MKAVGQRGAWAEGSRIPHPPHPQASLLISLTEPDSCLSVRQQHAQESGPSLQPLATNHDLSATQKYSSLLVEELRVGRDIRGDLLGPSKEDFLPWQSIMERRPFSIFSSLLAQGAALWDGASCHSSHQTPWGKKSRDHSCRPKPQRQWASY